MAKPAKVDKRRFEDTERKPWSKEEREAYLKRRDALAPYIKDLTTPHKSDKPKKEQDPLDKLLGISEEENDD